MKIVISLLVLAILILTGATGYFIYGFVLQLGELEIPEQAPVSELKVVEPVTEWNIEERIPEKMVEVTEIALHEEEILVSLEDISDHELVSVEKYSYIKSSNYFKYNKIFVFNEQGSERIFANSDDVYVKAGTLKKLIKVDEELKNQGYNLVIWIGYRDEILQQQLREHLEITMGIKEGRYDLVAAPGMSQHQMGTAVDVTLERIDGESLEMPSLYLDFSNNRLPSLHENNEALKVLQEAMLANEMQVYNGEWWHFNDSIREYLVEQ